MDKYFSKCIYPAVYDEHVTILHHWGIIFRVACIAE